MVSLRGIPDLVCTAEGLDERRAGAMFMRVPGLFAGWGCDWGLAEGRSGTCPTWFGRSVENTVLTTDSGRKRRLKPSCKLKLAPHGPTADAIFMARAWA